jgi:hypothetical protein
VLGAAQVFAVHADDGGETFRRQVELHPRFLDDLAGRHDAGSTMATGCRGGTAHTTAWAGAVAFEELLDTDADTLAAVADHVPGFRFVLEDISHETDEALRARATTALVRLALWCLGHQASGTSRARARGRRSPRRGHGSGEPPITADPAASRGAPRLAHLLLRRSAAPR